MSSAAAAASTPSSSAAMTMSYSACVMNVESKLAKKQEKTEEKKEEKKEKKECKREEKKEEKKKVKTVEKQEKKSDAKEVKPEETNELKVLQEKNRMLLIQLSRQEEMYEQQFQQLQLRFDIADQSARLWKTQFDQLCNDVQRAKISVNNFLHDEKSVKSRLGVAFPLHLSVYMPRPDEYMLQDDSQPNQVRFAVIRYDPTLDRHSGGRFATAS